MAMADNLKIALSVARYKRDIQTPALSAALRHLLTARQFSSDGEYRCLHLDRIRNDAADAALTLLS